MTSDFTRDDHLATRISFDNRALPSRALGATIGEFLDTRPHLSEFWTPIIALDNSAMEHNLQVMRRWCESRGLELMPHGKTTMAPMLWKRQLDAGSSGITVATAGQLRTARRLGFTHLMVANQVTDPHGVQFIADELANERVQVTSWVDSVGAVDAMEEALRGREHARPLSVLVELGALGGRTGARTINEAIAVAERVTASEYLRLVGVAGYEGCLGHTRNDDDLAAIRGYLRELVQLYRELQGRFETDEAIVTAGGSAYFDLVASAFEPEMEASPSTRWILRSGAYLTHDGGFYRGISPIDEHRVGRDNGFRSALAGFASVVSHPEPGLAFANAGKRDLPFDEGPPSPVAVADHLGAAERQFEGAVTALNDQHAFVRFEPGSQLRAGEVVRFELSHPCTTFDKWKLLPVVDSRESGEVVDLIATYF